MLGRGAAVAGAAGFGGGGAAGFGAGGAAGFGAATGFGAAATGFGAATAGFGAAAAGFAAAGFFAGAFAFTVFFAAFFATFFALCFFAATFTRRFAGAAFLAFLPFFAFFAFDFFAMIDLPIVRLPRDRAPPHHALRNCDRHYISVIRSNLAVRPCLLASSRPPASGRRSPSRSTRSDGPPGYRCPPRSG